MAPDDLRKFLRRQPFQPFRLHLTDGRKYDVLGSEWMMVTRTSTVVGTPGASGDGEFVDWIDNDHIVTVEPINVEPVH